MVQLKDGLRSCQPHNYNESGSEMSSEGVGACHLEVEK